jgi:hypothetical protein
MWIISGRLVEGTNSREMSRHRNRIVLGGLLIGRLMRIIASGLMLVGTFPVDKVLAQTPPAPAAQPASTQPFNAEQLDSLLASIALYPDGLLTQLLMASTFRSR